LLFGIADRRGTADLQLIRPVALAGKRKLEFALLLRRS